MKTWIYRLNILQRLLIYFGIVIIISITIVIWLIYEQAAKEIKKQTETYLEYIVENASYQSDLYIEELERATLPLINSNEVKSFLGLDSSQRYEYYYHYTELRKRMTEIELQNSDINLIYLLADNGQSILSGNNISLESNYLDYEELYQSLLELVPESGKVSVLANAGLYDREYVITVSRRIRGFSSYIPNGILGIEISAKSLEKLWDISQFKNGTSLWIFDENNHIVYHPEQKWFGEPIKENMEQAVKDQSSGTFTGEWEEEEMIFYYNQSPDTNWTLVAMTPAEIIYEPLSGLRNKLIIALSASLLVALIISMAFAKSIVNPLRKIQKSMKQAEIGEWEVIEPLKGTDEISSVVTSYNIMIEKLSALVDDLYKAELKHHKILYEKQSIEFQALQSQINPHFLHNTLETVNAYAILNDQSEISEMAASLSQMFRYSVRNLEIVTIQEEIDHVKNFLIIEKHRFQTTINIKFEIALELYMEEIVKLTLQPLVENAIHHGLRKQRKQGEVIIRVYMKASELFVDIVDNGSGITPDRLILIQNMLENKEYQEVDSIVGIGVSNVNRRIQIIFGEDYGLQITSIQGKGTNVRMKLPRNKQQSEPHHDSQD